MTLLARLVALTNGDSHSGADSSDEDPPTRKVPVPGWQTTLEASSFQYLLALPQGEVPDPRVRVANALLPKPRPAPVAAPTTTTATPTAAAAKGIAVPKKRGRPKGKREDKDREANSKLAQVEYYDDDDYETATTYKKKVPAKSGSAERRKTEREQQRVKDDDDELEERPYGTRRAAVRRKRSNSSSSINSLDFLMPESDDEAVIATGSDEPKKPVTDFGQKWSAKDDALLRRLGPRPNGETWLQIAEYFPARTIRGVKQRWQNLIKLGVAISSPSDDFEMPSPGPRTMTHTPSEEAGVGYESYESEEDDGARETKDGRGAQGAKWTPEDDARLMEMAAGRKMGESWIAIAAAFPGRPTNSAKQRWQRLIKRQA